MCPGGVWGGGSLAYGPLPVWLTFHFLSAMMRATLLCHTCSGAKQARTELSEAKQWESGPLRLFSGSILVTVIKKQVAQIGRKGGHDSPW